METNNESIKTTEVNKWFKTNQIETSVNGERKILMINHQCGEDKEALIGQLKMMIHGIETNFDGFAC